MSYVAMGLLITGILCLYLIGGPKNKTIKVFLFLVCAVSWAPFVAELLVYSLTGRGITYQAADQLKLGFNGMDLKYFWREVILVVGTWTVYIGCIGWVLFRKRSNLSIIGSSIGTICVILSCLLHPTTYYLTGINNYTITEQDKQEVFELYTEPSITITGDQKNFVFIYAESLERSFLDDKLFPNLTPQIQEFEDKSTSYTQITPIQVENTLGAMAASQCGIPMFGTTATMKESGGVTCIGDLLASQGYDLTYYGGSNWQWERKKTFLENHGFATTKGRDELELLLKDTQYTTSDWGIQDDSLFELAYQAIEQKAENDTPFGFFMLTLDTHAPDGSVTPNCEFNFENTYLNAIACSDQNISAFVNKIRSSSFSKDTVIILASDHLPHRNKNSEKLARTKRRNLFLINTHESYTQKDMIKNNAPGNVFDMGATVLSSIGFSGDIGFGRDLSKDGAEGLNQILHKKLLLWRPLIWELWDTPKTGSNGQTAANAVVSGS